MISVQKTAHGLKILLGKWKRCRENKSGLSHWGLCRRELLAGFSEPSLSCDSEGLALSEAPGSLAHPERVSRPKCLTV